MSHNAAAAETVNVPVGHAKPAAWQRFIATHKNSARALEPEHAELTHALDAALKHDALTILTRPDGKPWRENHFNHAVADAVRAAGLAACRFMACASLRPAWLAEAAASVVELLRLLDAARSVKSPATRLPPISRAAHRPPWTSWAGAR